jgi:hypothetical protein
MLQCAALRVSWLKIAPYLQAIQELRHKFPAKNNRKTLSHNREFCCDNRENARKNWDC